MKANLFIVGAMKAGTTSFTEMLAMHPQIYMSPIKEPHFFIDFLPKNLFEPSRFFSLDTYFERDFPNPHHIAKIERKDHYEKLFSLVGKNHRCLAEASTAYLHAPGSAKLIHQYNPDAKIIIITRDPLQRAFSHYKMDLGLGRVNKSFEDLIKKEMILYTNGSLPWNSYLGMSFYLGQINTYKSLFQNVLVINFEDLVKEKEVVMQSVSEFLGIDNFSKLDITSTNESRRLRFPSLFYVLKQLGLKDYFSKIFSSSFRQRLFKIFSSGKKQSAMLTLETKEMLRQIFIKESGIQ